MGDETALPAIGRRVEGLPAGANVTTIVIVADASEVQQIETQTNRRPCWVHRSIEGEDDAASLLRAVAQLELPAGDGFV